METSDPNLGGRPKDPVWNHFSAPDQTKSDSGKKKRRAICNYCQIDIAANPQRMKDHIARKCKKATAPVRQLVEELIEADGKKEKLSTEFTSDVHRSPGEDLNPKRKVRKTSELSSSAASSSQAFKYDTMERKNVLCFGDSLTWGYDADQDRARLPYDARWTSVLHRFLEHSINVIPEGLCGRTTVFEDPLQFSSFSLSGRSSLKMILETHKPIDLVILQLGVNDMNYRIGMLPSDIVKGIEILIDEIKTAGASRVEGHAPEILVLGPPNLRETHVSLDWGFHDCAKKSADVITAFVQRFVPDPSIRFIDTSKILSTGADGIHLDGPGNLLLANAIIQCIREIFEIKESVL